MYYYDGPDPIARFWKKVFEYGTSVINIILRTDNRVAPSDEEKKQHAEATNCHLCGVAFSSRDDVKSGRLTQKEARARTKNFHHNHL